MSGLKAGPLFDGGDLGGDAGSDLGMSKIVGDSEKNVVEINF